MTNQNSKAFTLTEVIVGLVVVTIIGFAAWMAVNVLSPASQATRLRIKAEHLITLCQEQLHQYASLQANFDGTGNNTVAVNNCDFNQPNNKCGFPDVSAQFPEFNTPILNYIAADSTSQIKKFDIQVSWQELGKNQVKDSVIYLARPPDSLPGNIYGLVTDNNGTPLDISTFQWRTQLQLQAKNLNGATSTTTPNVLPPQPPLPPSPDGGLYNYTFAQQGTNFPLLPAGAYQVSASASGYYPYPSGPNYTYPNAAPSVVVNGNNVRYPTIQMVPSPKDGSINVNVVDAQSGNLVAFYNFPGEVNPSREQVYQSSWVPPPPGVYPLENDSSSRNFDVGFNDINQHCFTLFTKDLYKSNWAGAYTCNGFSYQADGWSSAQADTNNKVINCGANWYGDSSSDNICLSQGQTVPETIRVVPVPTATVNVTIDYQGVPIQPPTTDNPVLITVNWHDGTSYIGGQSSNTGPEPYPITVPAEQDLFQDDPSHYVQITAQWKVPQTLCCDQNKLVLETITQTIGPLHNGGSAPTTINFVAKDSQQCGNANGQVIDAKANAPLPGAFVVLASLTSPPTDGDGNYAFQCPQQTSTSFLVPSGLGQTLTATDTTGNNGNGYYPFTSQGNSYYAASVPANIIAYHVNPLSPPPISLWPKGLGTITGTVTENAAGNPVVPNQQVILNLGIGSCPANTTVIDATHCATTTDENGKFKFDNVAETWPPSSNSILTQTPVQNDNLTVADSQLYNAYSSSSIYPKGFTVTANTTQTINIVLDPKSGI